MGHSCPRGVPRILVRRLVNAQLRPGVRNVDEKQADSGVLCRRLGWDPCFEYQGKTYAEMDGIEKVRTLSSLFWGLGVVFMLLLRLWMLSLWI